MWRQLLFPLNEHFKKFSWYNPRFLNVDYRLTECDKYNINLVQNFEKTKPSSKELTDKTLTGVWSSSAIMPSDWPERFMFYTDGTCIYGNNNMRHLRELKYVYGKYTLNGNILKVTWDKRTIVIHSAETEFSGAFGNKWKDAQDKDEELTAPLVSTFSLDYSGEVELFKELTREILNINGYSFYKYDDDPDKGTR